MSQGSQDSEVVSYKEAEANFKETFHTGPQSNFFLISKSWLDQWKRRYGYDGESDKTIVLGPINSDIGMKPKVVLKYDPIESHMWNTVLQEGKVEGEDFEVISEEMWRILKDGHKVEFTIQRDSRMTSENKRVVNVHLKKSGSGNVIDGDQHVPPSCRLKDFLELLAKTLQTVTQYSFMRHKSVRLYKCPIEWTYATLQEKLTEQLKGLNYHDAPSLSLPELEYIDPEVVETIEDCNLLPDQIMVMDAKELHKTWVIKSPLFKDEAKCEGCYQFKILEIVCDCKKVFYCSEDCRSKDESYHLAKCEREDSDEEKINSLQFNENSRNGLTGLRNLGNTCFMNSGIQCISNTPELLDFILNNKFKDDINMDNPLGSKGRLITKLANLIKKIWYDQKAQIAPFSFKKVIGELQPQFQGNQQHDAQELITFVLDGVHEDLNRIKKKPYIENPDSDGRDDHVVAQETWEIYKKRNDSVIIDNMYGLYRSQLQCPTCQKISITFDPYLMVNVAIPQDNRKVLKVSVVSPECIWDHQEEVFHYDKSHNLKIKDVIAEKGPEWLKAGEEQVILTCSSLYNQEDVFIDELLVVLKKKLKYRKLFVRRLTPYELAVPTDNRAIVLVHSSYHQNGSYSWKKDLLESQNFIFNKQASFQEIHLELYRAHLTLLKDFPDFDPAWMEETPEQQLTTYKNHIVDKFWILEFKSNQRYQFPCSFCTKEICNDCQVPFTAEQDLNTCLDRGDKLMQAEIYIVWKVPFRFTGKIDDNFDDWKRFKSMTPAAQVEELAPQQSENYADNSYQAAPVYTASAGAIPLGMGPIGPMGPPGPAKNKKEETMTLQDCLKFSAKPEQLAEDNTWYCNRCKDHVQALKTMQVYAAPKILLFHLKRFKDSQKYFKSKLQTNVLFPLSGLDMKDFLLEHRLPNDMVDAQGEPQEVIYDLFAVCNHFGGLGGGHYTAYCKNKDTWYNFDDARVSEVKDPQSIVGSQAYVLFYRRRD